MTHQHARFDAALSQVRRASFLLDGVRAASTLRDAAAADGGQRTVALLATTVLDTEDTLTAIASVKALAGVLDDGADAFLSDLLSADAPWLREHAAEALGRRLAHLHAIGRLVALVAAGGFPGMIAQDTLERWAPAAPEHLALALEGALAAGTDRAGRARLVETLGLVPGELAARALLRIAAEEDEEHEARTSALAALGDRYGTSVPNGLDRTARAASALIHDLAAGDGDLAPTARLAALDLAALDLAALTEEPRQLRAGAARRCGDLRVAQLFLHADLDRGLTRAGAGDTGGVATLLVRLGDALVQQPGIAQVVTLSRGSQAAALAALSSPGLTSPEGAHVLIPVPLSAADARSGPGLAPPAMAQAWPARIAVRRGLRRALAAVGGVDVLHLRMADVGSMVAADVAARACIPTVFTLAPDPHAVIAALDATGALTRQSFGAADATEHYWYRLDLVERLGAQAAHRVLFPRPRLEAELQALLGVRLAVGAAPGPTGSHAQLSASVVPEGIDLAATRAARDRIRCDGPGAAGLQEVLDGLPPARRDLPVLLSVGRLARVKGMATVVEAWAADPGLRERANLLIVGGDLHAPSPEEADQLQRIGEVLTQAGLNEHDSGLLLVGHRPHDVVTTWMAALAAAGGAYVCASLKEEFGLALLEALAAGLVVVAPAGGGPATYVEDGATGLLVDTRDPADVRRGIHAALDLTAAPDRARLRRRAQDLVAAQFTIEAMAHTLAGIYTAVGARVRA